MRLLARSTGGRTDSAPQAALLSWSATVQHLSLPSLLAEEEVREEVGHVLVELILGRQQHRLVVEEQQQQVEEEEHHDSKHHHEDGRNAVLLGNHTSLRVQWLQQVRQTSADAIAFWERVAFTVRCCSLGVAHRVVAWPFRGHLIVPDHVDLALRGGRVHEAQLAAEGPQAGAASKQGKPWAQSSLTAD